MKERGQQKRVLQDNSAYRASGNPKDNEPPGGVKVMTNSSYIPSSTNATTGIQTTLPPGTAASPGTTSAETSNMPFLLLPIPPAGGGVVGWPFDLPGMKSAPCSIPSAPAAAGHSDRPAAVDRKEPQKKQ